MVQRSIGDDLGWKLEAEFSGAEEQRRQLERTWTAAAYQIQYVRTLNSMELHGSNHTVKSKITSLKTKHRQKKRAKLLKTAWRVITHTHAHGTNSDTISSRRHREGCCPVAPSLVVNTETRCYATQRICESVNKRHIYYQSIFIDTPKKKYFYWHAMINLPTQSHFASSII